MSSHHPDEIQQHMLALLKKAKSNLRKPVTIEAPAAHWYAIHGMIQMALRHPEAAGDDRAHQAADAVLDAIERALLELGIIDRKLLHYLRHDQAEIEAMSREKNAEGQS